jgi:4-diphosphocytidyl-2-C-methyl-D-erythritol kinase
LKLSSPAKINLFLNVLSKREDGYHEIHTLFERVSLCDELTILPYPSGIKIETDSAQIPRGRSNLVFQAAQLLRQVCGISRGALIRIKKNIPVGAGLGGGSSNAATALLGLNRFWKAGLSRKKLLELASKIGSDVPFFILETPFAVGQGRGEILKPVSMSGLKIWHCLVKPSFSISTKKAYQNLRLSALTLQKTDVRMLVQSVEKSSASGLSKLLTNDLELTLNKRVKTIFEIKKKLIHHGALVALMSGSGSSVFGIYKSKTAAVQAAGFLKKDKNLKVFVVSTF